MPHSISGCRWRGSRFHHVAPEKFAVLLPPLLQVHLAHLPTSADQVSSPPGASVAIGAELYSMRNLPPEQQEGASTTCQAVPVPPPAFVHLCMRLVHCHQLAADATRCQSATAFVPPLVGIVLMSPASSTPGWHTLSALRWLQLQHTLLRLPGHDLLPLHPPTESTLHLLLWHDTISLLSLLDAEPDIVKLLQALAKILKKPRRPSWTITPRLRTRLTRSLQRRLETIATP